MINSRFTKDDGRKKREEGSGKMEEGSGKMEDKLKGVGERVHLGDQRIKSVRDLIVYRKAFDSAMKIYELTKSFPKDERYSLIDQIRRSSRSVCSNISEGWRKRRYIAVFVNKLSDAAQEAAETQTWLEFALQCKYIDSKVFELLDVQYEEVFAMLNGMERKADSFCKKQ